MVTSLGAIFPIWASAESSGVQGNGALSASASVMFKVVIPPVIGLNVVEGAAAQGMMQVNVDPASPLMRAPRGGVALQLPQQRSDAHVVLRSNLRQVTIVQDAGGKPTVTVVSP